MTASCPSPSNCILPSIRHFACVKYVIFRTAEPILWTIEAMGITYPMQSEQLTWAMSLPGSGSGGGNGVGSLVGRGVLCISRQHIGSASRRLHFCVATGVHHVTDILLRTAGPILSTTCAPLRVKNLEPEKKEIWKCTLFAICHDVS